MAEIARGTRHDQGLPGVRLQHSESRSYGVHVAVATDAGASAGLPMSHHA